MPPVALEDDRFMKHSSGGTLRRNTLSRNHRKHISEDGLEGVLSATLLAADSLLPPSDKGTVLRTTGVSRQIGQRGRTAVAGQLGN